MNRSPENPGSERERWLTQQVATYPLLDALRGRRSRRFGLGMQIDDGPFTFKSAHPAYALSDYEEAALAFAACGLTGYALADLAYGKGQGGRMLDGLRGRTVASPDAVNTVSVAVINDEATYLLKRPQDFTADEVVELIQLGDAGKLVELYHKMRIKIRDGRTSVPVIPGLNFNINRWSLYAKGGTYFLPINEITGSYINALLESFDPEMGLYLIDERNWFSPPGIGRFAKSKGGPLHDSADDGRVVTLQGLELSLAEAIAVEQGMILQNLGLMSQLLGLGGFANYARNEYGWLEALGFQMDHMLSSRYVGANWLITLILNAMRRNPEFPYAVGLKVQDQVVLHAYCPPYYSSMADAVRAFVDHKFGEDGVFRHGAYSSAWKDPGSAVKRITPPTDIAVEATIACCEYIYKRYGRFPGYSAPFRTVIAYQATHVDVDFYDRFFRPEALTRTQREHHDLLVQAAANGGTGFGKPLP